MAAMKLGDGVDWYVKPDPKELEQILDKVRGEAERLRRSARRERPWL